MYQTQEPPFDPHNLPEYLSRELRRIEQDLRNTTWINVTFDAGWYNRSVDVPSTEHSDVQYKKQRGVVYLKGAAHGAATGSDQVVFTLPAGYRPLDSHFVPCTRGSGAADWNPQMVIIRADGTVTSREYPSAGEWISFDGISFPAEK